MIGATKPDAHVVRLFASLHRALVRLSRGTAARARITEGDERDARYERFCRYLSSSRASREATDRLIPVVVLEPVGPPTG